MADNRFARMLQTAREATTEGDEAPQLERANLQQDNETHSQPIARRPKPQAVSTSKNRGRPATGKRSDPDYESTTIFLRRDTKSAAAKLLIDDRGQDLSDVLEKLLSGWVRRQS
jgi:hypothetical protein